MAGSFSARLAELRKKKGISQKQAASALGISQALLSHYEKGIRECSLDFVKKAAKYYDVTCDYLLGMTNSKKSISVDFDEGDESQDSELTISTIYRAATILERTLSKRPSDADITKDFLAVGLYRIISAAVISGELSPELIGYAPEFASAVADVTSARIIRQLISGKTSKQKNQDLKPLCVKTVIDAAEKKFSTSIKELGGEL
ncbi:MAG: helix-turn-helix domain-containing protein [Clostridiales bacterium]|nr:helix-turn-helix transcriptional regulator [Clostridia bacterium]MCR4563451.1 helix-turn-helix domain-containing protein [Clostridiales bacterium]